MALIECPNCHRQISSNTDTCVHCGAKFKVCPDCHKVFGSQETTCPHCGYKVTTAPITQNQAATAQPRENLPTGRGLFLYLIFTALTFGIYALYFIHAVSHDLNIACKKDGKHTTGLFLYIIFTVLTLGIYSLVWGFCACDRMAKNFESIKRLPNVTGLSWILWQTFGMLLFGLGALVANYKLIHSLNDINALYNSGKI